jgi:23S rRNA (cytidine1920-2'-O)/16S rRNA (cytidine1409-2'-O)-methyltransferase
MTTRENDSFHTVGPDFDEEAGGKGDFVGRGGLKLQAALKLLGGGEAIKGAECIDIGASTGGFTDCMLREGAVKVTAIDVGHGQLHQKLRDDARVVSLEKTNFKTVSLHVAPGPFDYFVIDVSFVAARTMLRPLAFRLKPGAEGFILVKPQFELPEGYVHDGDVKAEGLRTWALKRVIKRGEELGFEFISDCDSPVLGGSGTVEILTRWRYRGPSAEIARVLDRPEGAPPVKGKPGKRTGHARRPEDTQTRNPPRSAPRPEHPVQQPRQGKPGKSDPRAFRKHRPRPEGAGPVTSDLIPSARPANPSAKPSGAPRQGPAPRPAEPQRSQQARPPRPQPQVQRPHRTESRPAPAPAPEPRQPGSPVAVRPGFRQPPRQGPKANAGRRPRPPSEVERDEPEVDSRPSARYDAKPEPQAAPQAPRSNVRAPHSKAPYDQRPPKRGAKLKRPQPNPNPPRASRQGRRGPGSPK